MTRLFSTGNLGCSGGWANLGFVYIRDNGGVDGERCYPYTARVRNLKSAFAVHVRHSIVSFNFALKHE